MTGEFAIAVHALVYLNHKATTQSSEELARNVCTNPARIRKIMGKLKKSGFVIAKEGLCGGYCTITNVTTITLRQIIESLAIDPISLSRKPSTEEQRCFIASGMSNVMTSLYDDLNNECLKKLEQFTIADIQHKVFCPSDSA